MSNTIITSGAFTIDEETGEILEESGNQMLLTPAQFVPDTADGVDWVLQLLQVKEAHVAGLTARRAAILENINSEIERHERQRNWILKRFSADLEQFAKKELEGKKARTWTSPFGALSFRKTPGSVKVKEDSMALAIFWAREHDKNALLETTKLLVSKLSTKPEELPADLFEITPPGENFSIKTGVL